MKLGSSKLTLVELALFLLVPACAPQATPITVQVDTAATLALQIMQDLLTQTALAVTPTSPLPIATPTLVATETPTPDPTKSVPVKRPKIKVFTPCYYGPGPEYTLDSNIAENKKVEIVGIGSVPGWYIIINPYFHKQCWVNANDVEVDPAMDLSALPLMTPMPK